MGFEELREWVEGEWAVIQGAPISFLVAVIAASIFLRWIIKGQYETRLANAQSTIEMLEKRLDRSEVVAATEQRIAKVEAELERTSEPPKNMEFLRSEQTGFQLPSEFVGMTGAQEQLIAEKYVGKWTKVSGVVANTGLSTIGEGCHVILQETQGQRDPIALVMFDSMNDAVIGLNKGDEFSAVGEIESLDATGITLVHSRIG
jgi:hypothetical protein